MSDSSCTRTLPWDWYNGAIPGNVTLEEQAYLETTYSFHLCRSRVPDAVRIGYGATVYLGTMFDLGPRARVTIGAFALLHSAWITCDAAVEIGDYALISWNVALMDTYRWPFEPAARRRQLNRLAGRMARVPDGSGSARPIRIGRNTWIGFDCCVLPGVSIGEGSIVGARSVVVENVPPFTIVAGNPARVIRTIENDLPEGTEPAALIDAVECK